MWFLLILNSAIILFSLCVAIYGLKKKEINLTVSSLSVLAASISGLIATLVLKDKKDKERPFLILKPNYNRYGLIQISIENCGTEIAIIDHAKINNEIKLQNGKLFSKEIKGVTITPGGSVNYILLSLDEYKEKNEYFTTEGKIFYKDLNDKTYSNDIYFNIEQLGSTSYNDDEELKTNYELQKIPKEIQKLSTEIKKIRNNVFKSNEIIDNLERKRNNQE